MAAQFVPEAGMIGISLTDAGVELLGQRRGLDAYVTAGKTMGIPILYPWANRLGANTYTAEGVTVTLTPGEHGVRADPNGLPIHGVLAAYPGWRVTTESANELTAELDFGADPALLASFPFPHLLVVTFAAGRADADACAPPSPPTGDTAGPAVLRFPPVSAVCRTCRARSGSSKHRRCGTWPRRAGAAHRRVAPPSRRVGTIGRQGF